MSAVRQFSLPLFLHCREAFDDFFNIIDNHRSTFSTGVVHSFTGSVQEANDVIRRDLYIGLNGCSFKTEENIDVIKQLPIERILIETDAPWCEIRPSHAGFPFINSQSTLHPKMAKEKYVPGRMVKGRNEPCFIM